jgi:hypothetical protein
MVCCRGETGGKNAAWCACCWTASIWTTAPPLLFVGGLMLLPLVLFSDMCGSGGALGVRAAEGSDLCGLIGMNGTNTACNVSITLPAFAGGGNDTSSNSTNSTDTYTLSAVWNIEGSVRTLAEGCPADGSPDPWQDLLEQLGDSLLVNGPPMLNGMVDGMAEQMGVQEPLMDIVHNATESMGRALQHFAYGLGVTMGCGPMRNVVTSFTSPMCCGGLNAFYWIASPPILIGLILCCCGSWISLVARKRMGEFPWGPEWESVKQRSQGGVEAGAEAGAGYPTRGGGGAAPQALHTNPTFPKGRIGRK